MGTPPPHSSDRGDSFALLIPAGWASNKDSRAHPVIIWSWFLVVESWRCCSQLVGFPQQQQMVTWSRAPARSHLVIFIQRTLLVLRLPPRSGRCPLTSVAVAACWRGGFVFAALLRVRCLAVPSAPSAARTATAGAGTFGRGTARSLPAARFLGPDLMRLKRRRSRNTSPFSPPHRQRVCNTTQQRHGLTT